MDSPETRLNPFPYSNYEHLKVQLYEVRSHQRRGEGPTLWPSGQTRCSMPSNSRRSSVYSVDSIPHRIWVKQCGYETRKITKIITRDLQIFINNGLNVQRHHKWRPVVASTRETAGTASQTAEMGVSPTQTSRKKSSAISPPPPPPPSHKETLEEKFRKGATEER